MYYRAFLKNVLEADRGNNSFRVFYCNSLPMLGNQEGCFTIFVQYHW